MDPSFNAYKPDVKIVKGIKYFNTSNPEIFWENRTNPDRVTNS
jgi:hypothetical protein